MRQFQIISGDCIETMRKLNAESADLIFADPPYWMRVSGVLKRVEGNGLRRLRRFLGQFIFKPRRLYSFHPCVAS